MVACASFAKTIGYHFRFTQAANPQGNPLPCGRTRGTGHRNNHTFVFTCRGEGSRSSRIMQDWSIFGTDPQLPPNYPDGSKNSRISILNWSMLKVQQTMLLMPCHGIAGR